MERVEENGRAENLSSLAQDPEAVTAPMRPKGLINSQDMDG